MSRVGTNHLCGKVRGSTFRLTLAAALLDELGIVIDGPKKLSTSSEAELTTWMGEHLEVAVHRFPERDALADLEARALGVLDPPLNLDGCQSTPVRVELAATASCDLQGRRTANPPDRFIAGGLVRRGAKGTD